MPLHIFANRNRAGTYTMMLTIGAAIFALFFFLTQFIRNILGYSPLKAGVAFLPVTVTVTIGALAAISARLVGRVGPKLPMTVGPSLAAVGLFWLSFIEADGGHRLLEGPAAYAVHRHGQGHVLRAADVDRRLRRTPGRGRTDLRTAQHRPADRRLARTGHPGDRLHERNQHQAGASARLRQRDRRERYAGGSGWCPPRRAQPGGDPPATALPSGWLP